MLLCAFICEIGMRGGEYEYIFGHVGIFLMTDLAFTFRILSLSASGISAVLWGFNPHI